MIEEDNKTLWCGNLPEQATEELLYELFLQAGPLEKVVIPKDRDGRQKYFALITYCHEVSVPYAINLFSGTSLFHKTLTLQSRGKMALLTSPIRCVGPERVLEFVGQANVGQQFPEMAQNINEEQYKNFVQASRNVLNNDKLVLASLQGNWSHRYHPYRPTDNKRDEYRPRHNDNDYKNNCGKHPLSWRDRNRNNKKGNYHRRK